MLTRDGVETGLEVAVLVVVVILVLTFFGSLMGYSWGLWLWRDSLGLV